MNPIPPNNPFPVNLPHDNIPEPVDEWSDWDYDESNDEIIPER